ncbi:MAG: zinc ribbon domain-containing protein [Candidatus Zixiibacteriota bacterium]
MPMYEYACNECGRKFEELVRHEDETVSCPVCQSSDARKLLSMFASSISSGSGTAAPSCGSGDCGSGFS